MGECFAEPDHHGCSCRGQNSNSATPLLQRLVLPLIAYFADTGAEVESFSTPQDQWAQWRKLPVGSFVIGHQRIPAVLKRSPLGLQFFACAPGHAGMTRPESIEHQIAKIALVRGLRAVGVPARVEWPGTTPQGESWIADVFAPLPSGPAVFEVQMSQQHWDDYRARTHRYAMSGARCIWLVRDAHYNAFSKARIRFWMSQGLTLQQAMNHGMPDMPVFPLLDIRHWTENPESVRAAVFPAQQGTMTLRLRLEQLAAGVARGYVRYGLDGLGDQNWHWTPLPEGAMPSLSAPSVPVVEPPCGINARRPRVS